MTAALPASSSSILPTVMREGKPCGFMMRSGTMPLSVKGRSSWPTMRPHTPFWPCLELNLSPSSGLRVERNSTFTRKSSCSLLVSSTLSTYTGSGPL